MIRHTAAVFFVFEVRCLYLLFWLFFSKFKKLGLTEDILLLLNNLFGFFQKSLNSLYKLVFFFLRIMLFSLCLKIMLFLSKFNFLFLYMWWLWASNLQRSTQRVLNSYLKKIQLLFLSEIHKTFLHRVNKY